MGRHSYAGVQTALLVAERICSYVPFCAISRPEWHRIIERAFGAGR